MRQPIGSIWEPRAHRPAPFRSDRAARLQDLDRTPARHRPHGRGLSAEQEAVLELQALAGNNAVARALADGQGSGRITSIDAIELTREGMAPEKGIEQIREKTANKLTLALTQRGIVPYPPIMRVQSPEKVKDGFAARTQKVSSIPEPEVKAYWPKEGRHKLPGDSYLDVNHDWEEKLRDGEDQHVADARLSWELTWKKVQDTINSFAEKPGPPEASPEAATRALWKRYVAALPKDLRPEGDQPSEAKQREVLALKPGTFFAWMWEATVSRDSREYHTTRTMPAKDPKKPPKTGVVNDIVPHADFNVKKPTTEDFLAEMRAKWTPGRINVASKLKEGDASGRER